MERTVSYQIAEEMRSFQQKLDVFAETSVGDLDKLRQRHAAEMEAGSARIDAVAGEKRALEEKRGEQSRRAGEERERVERMQAELSALEERKTQLPAETEKARLQQGERAEAAEKLAAETETLREERSRQMAELARGIAFFRQRLGLEFVAKDGICQVRFKYIDPARPSKEFTFDLVVGDDNRYTMRDCAPAVDGVDPMLAELNATNDLGLFVQLMRRKFRASVGAA